MTPSPHKSVRLILVDRPDAAHSAWSAAAALQIAGQASDLLEALQLAQMLQPDVALVNLALPDGIGIVRGLAGRLPGLMVLVISRPGEEERLRQALQAGAAGYLPNEADPAAIAAAVLHALETRRPQPTSSAAYESSSEPTQSSLRRTGELVEAARIQNSLLPGQAPRLPGYDLAVRLLPARETSGDFYDFLTLDHSKLGIVIADVSDKGLGAALFMAMASTLFRTFVTRHPTLPGLTLSLVNERILSDTGGSSFVTAFLGVLEPDTGRLRYANAGHSPPLLLSAVRSKAVDRLARTGMALGILDENQWGQKLVKLAPGDALLLYTDGILEAQDRLGTFFGEQRLLAAARVHLNRPAGELCQGVLDELFRFTGGAALGDDIVLMVLKRR
jgi:sigma-B regulation protein RsbU (phosphoserine phosphatase)